MNINAQEWLDTLTQSSATFVAIIAALYTTKVLSISSEKQGIRRQIDILESELEERKNMLKRYVDEIEGIFYDDADKLISRFLKEQLRDVNLEFEPSIEGLSEIFTDEKQREINKYELKILELYYEKFRETYEEKKEEERKRREMEAKQRAIGIPDLGYLTGMFSETSPGFFLDFKALKPEYLRARELRNFDALVNQRDEENNRINVLERRILGYQEQQESLAYPRYINRGYLALIYFSITGVVIPLLFPIISAEIGLEQLWFMFFLFITGFFAFFIYLYFELSG